MRIALAQIQSGTEPSANLALVEDFTRRAADAGAKLVLFPEATMCRFGVPLAPIAEPLDGPWPSGVRAIAGRAGIVVVAGMFRPADDGRVTNTLIATGPGVDAHYDKIYLYDAFGFAESKTVAPGREPVVITVDGVGAGPGKLEQWTLLARARAIDTTGFVAAVGQAYPGDEIAASGPTGVGGSLVATAVGEVLTSAGPDPQLLVADLDLETAAKTRETIAVLRNRSEFAHVGKAQ